MSRISAVLAVAVFAVAAAATAAQAGDRPTLRLVGAQPVVVQGSAFRPRERVTVITLSSPEAKHLVVRAGRRGRFGVRLEPGIRACGSPLAVRAVGASGSTVTVRLPARPCATSPIRVRPRVQIPPPIR